MKHFFLAIIALYASFTASAQITLNTSSYPSAVAGTTDTSRGLVPLSLPPQTKGANQVWDMTPALYNIATGYITYSSVPTGTSFTSAQFITPNGSFSTDNGGGIGMYPLYGEDMFGIASAGFVQYGLHIDYQKTPMGGITSNPNDTFEIPAQDALFSKQLRHIAFPATYLSHWDDTVIEQVHGTLTIPVMSFNHTPLEFHIAYMMHDTVTGWGTMKLKNTAGVTESVNVLQVKSSILRIDSTFIGGVFITTLQKDYSGLPNGWQSSSYEYRYYTMNDVTPVADVAWDFSFTTPATASIQNKNFPPVGVPRIDNEGSSPTIFPNPVTGRSFSVQLPDNTDTWAYHFTDATGKMVSSGNIPAKTDVYTIELSKTIAPGVYYLQLQSSSNQISIQQVEVR